MKAHSASHSLVVWFCLLTGLTVFALSLAAETPAKTTDSCSNIEPSGVVAYYFYGNMRCATCRKLEAYSEEAITEGFAEEITLGGLIWLTVNTDDKEHEHFVTDFELVTKALVLVEYVDGEVERYKNLDRIWKLVGDKDAFIEYVQAGTREFIGSS